MYAKETPRVEPAIELLEREVHVVTTAGRGGEDQLVVGTEPQHVLRAHDELPPADPHGEAVERFGSRLAPESSQERGQASSELLGARQVLACPLQRRGQALLAEGLQ